MALLDEIAARLTAQGVGAVNSVIFMGSRAVLPSGDGPYVSLIETGGLDPAHTQNGTATERPTVQITTRAKDYPTARTKALAVYNALGGANGLSNVTLSGTFYLRVKPRQSVTDSGLDESGRLRLVFNIDVEKATS